MSLRGARRRSIAAAAMASVLLWTMATATAQQPDPDTPGEAPSVLTADTVTNNSATGVMTANGDVEISTGRRRLLADEVRYDRRSDKMFAKGNVVLIEPSGDAMFGDEVEVTGDLKEGFVQAVGMLLEDDSRIAANSATRRNGNVIEFDRAVYSPCPLCAEGKGGPLVADQGAAGRARRERPRR